MESNYSTAGMITFQQKEKLPIRISIHTILNDPEQSPQSPLPMGLTPHTSSTKNPSPRQAVILVGARDRKLSYKRD